MFQKFKKVFYFPMAAYFAFFAAVRLKFWKPRIIVITGSSGKTTLLHLIESQIGQQAKYSHHANSSFGIPFDILDLHRKDLTLWEWPILFLQAPFAIFKTLPKEKLYIVEADCDRPGEGKFLSKLLKPEVTLWTNVSRTHSANFGQSKLIDEKIVYEFGYFAEKTKNLVIVNSDFMLLVNELKRAKCEIENVSIRSLESYEISLGKTHYRIENENYSFNYLLPMEVATSILMCKKLIGYLDMKFDESFSNFSLPNGRSSFFRGVKNTTLIDSTYNANLDSMKAMINMFGNIKAQKKWVVLADMIEQGEVEEEEHVKLAKIISQYDFEKIVLMGPRITKYTFENLQDKTNVMCFLNPKEVLDYLETNITGEEIILFKGARFLEGVIENLLKNKSDTQYLVRREKVWEIRRKKFGL
ncbi:MAG TPA: Mur ligase family protein [Alphaproteobacteria bacterium]|jgi:UDP-N-acetylmuramyl pentapeptide synthase|nr:Mur ligase family protein [Alphaproteobacteria bacterium]